MPAPQPGVLPLNRVDGWPARLGQLSQRSRSRCLRHSEINDEYKPSRRSSVPLPLVQRLVLSQDLRLVAG